eukprot:10796683-Lingulodinium_polyedra.AAC.1
MVSMGSVARSADIVQKLMGRHGGRWAQLPEDAKAHWEEEARQLQVLSQAEREKQRGLVLEQLGELEEAARKSAEGKVRTPMSLSGAAFTEDELQMWQAKVDDLSQPA